jgi:RNA polymerase sigma-70 factor (ECF subfamily)
MASNASTSSGSPGADELASLRPALHRYAARMVGSVLDGEDIVQEALARAIAALERAPPEGDAAPWLFRITHNAAVDFLRTRERTSPERNVEDDDMVSDADEASRRLATRAAMSVFLRLPPSQRGTVILKDVLGYSNEEIADILGTTIAASKAALHRGRKELRLYADEVPAVRSADPDELAGCRLMSTGSARAILTASGRCLPTRSASTSLRACRAADLLSRPISRDMPR